MSTKISSVTQSTIIGGNKRNRRLSPIQQAALVVTLRSTVGTVANLEPI